MPISLEFGRPFFSVPALRASLGIAEPPGESPFLFFNAKNKFAAALNAGENKIFHKDTSDYEPVVV